VEEEGENKNIKMGIVIYLIIISIISIIRHRYNRIVLLISLELLLISISIFFIYSSLYLDNIFGLYFSILLLSLGAIETAIGLSLLLLAY
jgi:NADH-ubiquinone oxidoreductase chain 4L